MKKPILSLFVLLILIGNSSFARVDQKFTDKIFDPDVKTAMLYPNYNTATQRFQAPIVSLANNPGLTLEFDALLEDYEQFQAKIIHCNADWSKSMLTDIEVLSEYNSFDLNDFEYSENTKILYVNYVFQIPPTRVSGNFIVKVFRYNEEDKPLLTKRFIVFEDKVDIKSNIGLSSSVSNRDFNQQIEFSINYRGTSISNPHSDLHVVVRQNNRWDNAIYGLRPTLVRPDQAYVEYRHFNTENNFRAGNEFRFFDLRSYLYRGQNVAHMDDDATPMTAHLIVDHGRSHLAYSQYLDLNGQFFIDTQEAQADYLECDYFDVHFKLSSSVNLGGNVYVLGAFNDWTRSSESKMHYDANSRMYTAKAFLKQGFYNYTYYLEDDPYFFEGSYYQTENTYDIIVYYRPLGSFTEKVIGYSSFTTSF